MNDPKTQAKKRPTTEGEGQEPLHTIREGAIAASIWMKQSPSGYAYYDFSITRSWKSMSTGKTGYSKNFFARNKPEIISVIEQACAWIESQEKNLGSTATEVAA